MLTLVVGGMGGSETYARALTSELAAQPGVEAEVILAESAQGFSAGIPERIVRGLRIGHSNRARLIGVAQTIARAPRIRTEFADADVVHYPFTVPVPRAGRGQATVQSLLDIQHLDLPHLFSRAELLYRRPYYEGFARTADSIVTISHFAKQRIVDQLGIDPTRIHVAHLGVDQAHYTPNLGERENFVLYPARGWPHKNHARLIEAMAIVRKTIPDLRLVLTGGGQANFGDLPEWVDRRGLVPAEELLRLYQSASALVYPSLYEGFGLPPLEAMASGCPVAVSNAGSLPEIVGNAAVQFDPLDPDAIAAGVVEAIARGPQLAAAGREHVRRFTWSACAEVHVEAYRAALENR